MNAVFVAASFIIGVVIGSLFVAQSFSSLRCAQAVIMEGKAHCVAYVDKDFIR